MLSGMVRGGQSRVQLQERADLCYNPNRETSSELKEAFKSQVSTRRAGPVSLVLDGAGRVDILNVVCV